MTVVSAGTFEGGQELQSRSELTAKELLREVGSVLRMSESEAAALAEVRDEAPEDQCKRRSRNTRAGRAFGQGGGDYSFVGAEADRRSSPLSCPLCGSRKNRVASGVSR